MDRLIRAATARRWSLAALFAGVLLPLYVFGQLAEEIRQKGGFVGDSFLLRQIHGHATPTLDAAMLFFSRAGAPLPMALFFGAAIATLLLLRRRGDALFFAVAVAGAMAINFLAKLLFGRARPALWDALTPEHDYSFPSGHAMGSMAVVAALVVFAWRTPWRWPVVALGGAFVLAVGLSRLYLGVHYPSDVVAGWCASVAWVAGVQFVRATPFLHFRDRARHRARQRSGA